MELAELAFEHAPIGIAITEQRIIRACNPAFAGMFRTSTGQLIDTAMAALYPSVEDYERIGAAGLRQMQENPLYNDERIMRRLDGGLFWCRVHGRSLLAGEPFARAIWTFADMSAERPVIDLSPRERDVAMRTCQGQTAKEIARGLGLSHRTVEQYRARLLEKTGARNQAEFVTFFAGLPV